MAREIGHENDRERTTWFFYPNDFLFAYPALFTQLNAFRDIVMLSDSVLIAISYGDIFQLRNAFIEFALFMDSLRDRSEMDRSLFAAQIYHLTAQQRYDRLFSEHSELFKIAKRKDIASFLGIKTDNFGRYFHS